MRNTKNTKNDVRIEGIVSENNIELGSYQRNGRDIECLRGHIVVKTQEVINGEEKLLNIRVPFFANKYKKDGQPNQQYKKMSELLNFKSIAEVGEDNADRIAITLANLQENIYGNKNSGRVSMFPILRGVFFKKVSKAECQPQANFEIECLILEQGYEYDKDGVETLPYKFTCAVPQYGGIVDILDFKLYNENMISQMSEYYQRGMTVKFKGKLDFSTTTETRVVEDEAEVMFGEPTTRTFTNTINVSDLIIIQGTAAYEGDLEFDGKEIEDGLADREIRIDNEKKKASGEVVTRPKPIKTPTQFFEETDDIGF